MSYEEQAKQSKEHHALMVEIAGKEGKLKRLEFAMKTIRARIKKLEQGSRETYDNLTEIRFDLTANYKALDILREEKGLGPCKRYEGENHE